MNTRLYLLLAPSPSSEPSSKTSTLASSTLCLQLAVQRWKLHMVEGNVVKQGLARNGTELWRKIDQVWFPLQHLSILIILIQSIDQWDCFSCVKFHVCHLKIKLQFKCHPSSMFQYDFTFSVAISVSKMEFA